MFMTLVRHRGLMERAKSPLATPADIHRACDATVQRIKERGFSKLARRLRRKVALGRSGSF
jgi:aspartate aminotransferase-like enzyme